MIRYRAIAADGRARTGAIEAQGVADATRRLSSQGLIVLSAAIERRARKRLRQPPIASNDVVPLVRQWATLLSAGLTVDDALAISETGMASRPAAGVIATLRRKIRDGATFHAALAEAALLPAEATVLVEAGERAGALPRVLERLAVELGERRAGKDGIVTALLYPAALLVTTIVAILVIVQVIAPNLAELFPDATRMPSRITALLAFASVTRYALPLLIAGLAAAVAAFVLAGRSDGGRLARDRLMLRVPFLGGILRSQDCARFASSAALMIGCGMTPSAALPLAVAAVHNRSMRRGLVEAITRAAQGSPLQEALAQSGALPADLLALVGAGLRAGRLGEVLRHGGDIHSERARSRVMRFSALLTPAITVFAGIVVGGLAYLVMTAVLSLNEIALQ